MKHEAGWISKIRDQIAELHLTMGTYQDDGNTRYNEKGEAIGGIGNGDMRTNRYFEIARHTTDPVKEATLLSEIDRSGSGDVSVLF